MLKRAAKRQKKEHRGGCRMDLPKYYAELIEGDGILDGFSLAGDILTGVVRDPLGTLGSIGETFSNKEIWEAADDYFRKDVSFQKALGITKSITDVLQKILNAVPGIKDISKPIFKGWDALAKEFKAKPGTQLTNKIADWGRGMDEWDRIKSKHPDIGLGLMGTVFHLFKKLGMTKLKAAMPEILKDYHRRQELYNKYLEQDIKEQLEKQKADSVIELATNSKGQSDAILKAIKERPSEVSPEFHIALFKYMRSKSPKSGNIIEAKRILQPGNFSISSQLYKLDKQRGWKY